MAKPFFMSKFDLRILATLAALLAVGAITQSCESHGTDAAAPYETFNMPANELTYPMLKQMALSSCLQCHDEFNSQAGFDQDIVAGKPDQSQLIQMVESGEMPKGGLPHLSDAQIAMIRTFIENDKSGAPPLPPLAATYASLKANLIDQSCISCHSQTSVKPHEPYMDTYDEVNDASDDMATELLEGSMPPKGHQAPSEEVKKAFVEWVNNGAPNN